MINSKQNIFLFHTPLPNLSGLVFPWNDSISPSCRRFSPRGKSSSPMARSFSPWAETICPRRRTSSPKAKTFSLGNGTLCPEAETSIPRARSFCTGAETFITGENSSAPTPILPKPIIAENFFINHFNIHY